MYINQNVRGAVRRYPTTGRPRLLSGFGALGDTTVAYYDASGTLQCQGPDDWTNMCKPQPGWTKKILSGTQSAPATAAAADVQDSGVLDFVGKLLGGAATGSANVAAMTAAQQQAYLKAQQGSSTTTYLLLGALGLGALYLIMGD